MTPSSESNKNEQFDQSQLSIMSVLNRRSSIRYNYSTVMMTDIEHINLDSQENYIEAIKFETTDISGGGMKIISKHPIPSNLTLTFSYYDEMTGNWLDLVGKVIWETSNEDKTFLNGIQFIN